mgnify:CR=1 FL=1
MSGASRSPGQRMTGQTGRAPGRRAARSGRRHVESQAQADRPRRAHRFHRRGFGDRRPVLFRGTLMLNGHFRGTSRPRTRSSLERRVRSPVTSVRARWSSAERSWAACSVPSAWSSSAPRASLPMWRLPRGGRRGCALRGSLPDDEGEPQRRDAPHARALGGPPQALRRMRTRREFNLLVVHGDGRRIARLTLSRWVLLTILGFVVALPVSVAFIYADYIALRQQRASLGEVAALNAKVVEQQSIIDASRAKMRAIWAEIDGWRELRARIWEPFGPESGPAKRSAGIGGGTGPSRARRRAGSRGHRRRPGAAHRRGQGRGRRSAVARALPDARHAGARRLALALAGARADQLGLRRPRPRRGRPTRSFTAVSTSARRSGRR